MAFESVWFSRLGLELQTTLSFAGSVTLCDVGAAADSYFVCRSCHVPNLTHKQGPRNKFSTGGAKGERLSVSQLGVEGGGVRGHAPPENFDFNSSKMTGNAFKNNKRNV